MKKSELKEKAEKLMKLRGVDVVYATSDGQLFFEANAAELHKNTNAKKAKLEVFPFGTEQEDQTSTESGLNAKETIAKVKTMEDVTELLALQIAEEATEKPRSSVLKAIGKRNAELAPDGGEKNDNKRKDDDK
jgi:hypothetical protein